MSLHQHEKLIEKKYTFGYKIQRFLILIIYGFVIASIIYVSYTDKQLAAGLSVFSAAVIFALQNFVASFFARLYIRGAGLFEKGDIIKSGNPFMSAMGEVESIGFFFTTLREIEETNLSFTDKIVSFPNNLIFNSGIFNFTKNNLLFWHEMKYLLSCELNEPNEAYVKLKKIIDDVYTKSLQDKIYTTSFLYKNKKYKPKYLLTPTTQGLEVKVRIMTHFYKAFDTNNQIAVAVIQAHKDGFFKLVVDKDYQWL